MNTEARMPRTNQRSPRLPLAELATHPEWSALTVKQRMFLSSYIQSGLDTGIYDAEFAVRSSYNVDEKNAVILSYELLANSKIRRVLDLHFGRTEFDSVLADLAKIIKKSLRRDSKTGLSDATITAIKFYEKHSGTAVPKSRKSSKKKSKGKRHAS
jgi:hypothetical protein